MACSSAHGSITWPAYLHFCGQNLHEKLQESLREVIMKRPRQLDLPHPTLIIVRTHRLLSSLGVAILLEETMQNLSSPTPALPEHTFRYLHGVLVWTPGNALGNSTLDDAVDERHPLRCTCFNFWQTILLH